MREEAVYFVAICWLSLHAAGASGARGVLRATARLFSSACVPCVLLRCLSLSAPTPRKTQVQRTCEALDQHGFTDITTLELLLRAYEVTTETFTTDAAGKDVLVWGFRRCFAHCQVSPILQQRLARMWCVVWGDVRFWSSRSDDANCQPHGITGREGGL